MTTQTATMEIEGLTKMAAGTRYAVVRQAGHRNGEWIGGTGHVVGYATTVLGARRLLAPYLVDPATWGPFHVRRVEG